MVVSGNQGLIASRSMGAENVILVGRLGRVARRNVRRRAGFTGTAGPGGLAQLVATMSPIQERDGRPEAPGMQVTDD
jgi:hypothetical protein